MSLVRNAISTWPEEKLGDFLRIKHGFAFKGEFFTDSGKHILLTPGNFREDGGLKLKGEKEKFYSGDFPAEFLLCRGDFLIVLTDLTQNAPILGSPAIIDADQRYLHNQRLGKVVDLDTKRLDSRFLFYLLNHHAVRAQIKATATGATVKHTAPDRIYAVRFRLPPLSVQQNVASALSAYDDLIENNTRRIRILEEMTVAIYREWFVHFRFPGHQNVRMIDSPVGKLPQGWRAGILGDVAGEVRRSVDPSEIDPTTPYFGLEHLPRKSITFGDWGFAKDVQSTKLAFREGEILFGKIRPYFHKVGVAPVDGVSSSDAIIIVPATQQAFGLVICCVSSDEFVAHATQTSQGTKMPRANWNVLVKYPVVIPPPDLLTRFDGIIRDFVSLAQNLMFRNRNLRKTRDLLLPKLISGEVDVSKLELEEATSA